MSEPIIFISNQIIKTGKLDEYTQYYQQVAENAKENKPGTLSHVAFIDQTDEHVSVIHIFPNVRAMEQHILGVDEIAKNAAEFFSIVSFDIYGDPGEKILEFMKKVAGSGVPINHRPRRLGGYIRFAESD